MADIIPKRERKIPKRYINEVSSEFLPQTKSKRKSQDHKLYPVVITDVDKSRNRVKIHYVGYSDSFDEWRACCPDMFQRIEPMFVPTEQSLIDRKELVHGELYRSIKRKLYSGRKDDPETRIDVRIHQDVFDDGLALIGKETHERGKTVYRVVCNRKLDAILGSKWDERIFNANGDFAYVIEGTVRYWMTRKTAIEEFKLIGDKYIRSEIEDSLIVVFTFVRGDGNSHNYSKRN